MPHFTLRDPYSHDIGPDTFTTGAGKSYCMVPSAGESSHLIIVYNFSLSGLSLGEATSVSSYDGCVVNSILYVSSTFGNGLTS